MTYKTFSMSWSWQELEWGNEVVATRFVKFHDLSPDSPVIPAALLGKTLVRKLAQKQMNQAVNGHANLADVTDDVEIPPKPAITEHQTLTRDAENPVLVQGVWTIEWVIVNNTQDAAYLISHRKKKVDQIREKRRQVEAGGLVLGNGMVMRSDKESQAALGNEQRLMAITPGRTIDWEMADGEFVVLNKANVDSMDADLSAHVQAARTNQRVLYDLLKAATTVAQIDAIDTEAGWPSNQ